jgi:hypothetical protein
MTGPGRIHGTTRTYARIGIAAAAIALACGCTVYRPVVTRPPTLGEELIQLDAARRDGLLTQAEHDRRRAATIAAWKRLGDAPIESLAAPK